MMIRWLLLLSFSTFTVGDYPIQICTGQNEEFLIKGTPCQPTCDNRNPACTKNTVPGCFCKQGYIRNKDNICIQVERCPIDCGPNEEFLAEGTACQPTCDNRNPGCTKNLVPGCFCKQGYIRNKDNRCIQIEHCPIICGTNEEFSTCGTCDPTCENLYPTCTKECKVGCFCKKGFVRDFRGSCILSRNCLKCYGPNEVPGCLPCPKGKLCAATLCPAQGCVCEEGFVRRNGICEIEYPERCSGPNEVSICKPVYCPPNRICPAVACINECVCRRGFIRKNGVCVQKNGPRY